MLPDLNIMIRFRTTEEGGRNEAVQGPFYGCPMRIDDRMFDCRLLLEHRILKLGETYQVLVKLLNPKLAKKYLSVGKDMVLWEGKDIADGKILKIY